MTMLIIFAEVTLLTSGQEHHNMETCLSYLARHCHIYIYEQSGTYPVGRQKQEDRELRILKSQAS